MRKTFGLILITWSLSACGLNQPAPITVNIEVKENPAHQYFSYASMYQSIIEIQSTVDQVQVNRVLINRGNCPISHWRQKNPNLKFGNAMQAVLSCDMEQVREVTVDTDQGEFTFNF